MMRILVVDDHVVVRNGLCRLLSDQPDMEVVASVAHGLHALQLLKDGLKVNIMLTDMTMPGMDGLELTRQVIAFQKSMRVVMLTLCAQAGVKPRALEAGAKDCLCKDGDLDYLLAAIRTVHCA